ncbi:hypothetical protein P879_10562 [Paragonimus westermani]|uniref:Uncharacterized protein n=1 Tax=Paragonimus westermani TaxID=34504 RepID=A0A8T0D3F5_9TREM|nr:hypothetical protein P879_10562 [Paragonimus westermani]
MELHQPSDDLPAYSEQWDTTQGIKFLLWNVSLDYVRWTTVHQPSDDLPAYSEQWDTTQGIKFLNLKRSTCQCIVLIYYNLDQVSFGKFRNTFIVHRPVMRAYGNGEFVGMAKDICCVEGVFPKNQNVGLLTFDHPDEATKCIESKPELREPHHYGGKDLFIIPLCSPAQSWPGYRFIQLDIYEPKNSTVFTKYMNILVPIVTRHGGHVIAGTTQSGHFMGARRPSFFFIVQWRNRDSFFACNAEVTPLQRESGASCTSRILFELDTQHFAWC